MVKRASAALALACVCSAVAEAKVVRIEILKVERVDPPATGPQSATPPYEQMSGKFYGELDPTDPKNALITDIERAPKNARGKVEYVGTFTLMKPVDGSFAPLRVSTDFYQVLDARNRLIAMQFALGTRFFRAAF